MTDPDMNHATRKRDIMERLYVAVPYGLEDATVLADARAEIDRLRTAIDTVLHAIDNSGSHPEYHHYVRCRHESEWPILWRAISSLRGVRRN